MNTFLQLNTHKLYPMFVRISLIFLAAVLIPLSITYMTGTVPNEQFILYVILVACIGFPGLIIFFGFLIWQLNHKARQKAYSKKPFDQIEEIGFFKTQIGDTSKLSLIDEIKEGSINGFTLRMDISKEKGPRFIEFDIPVEWKKLDKGEFNRIAEEFKQYNGELRIGSITKRYDTKQHSLQTILDLKQDLELFTKLLRQEGFEASL